MVSNKNGKDSGQQSQGQSGRWWRGLYDESNYIMGSGHMEPLNSITDMTKNIIFIGGR